MLKAKAGKQSEGMQPAEINQLGRSCTLQVSWNFLTVRI